MTCSGEGTSVGTMALIRACSTSNSKASTSCCLTACFCIASSASCHFFSAWLANLSKCFFSLSNLSQRSAKARSFFFSGSLTGGSRLLTCFQKLTGQPQSLQHREHHILIDLHCRFFNIVRLDTRLSWLHSIWSTPKHWPSH